MARVKFISTSYLKENTPIEENVDDSKLTPIIMRVQQTHLIQAIGSGFYNHLSDAVFNGTLTTDETALIKEYIQPMVAEYVVYEAIPLTHFKLTNKGNVKQNSEWSESSSLAELKYMRNSVRDVAEFYGNRLITYLCDNSALFPEYINPSQPENVKKTGNTYSSGLFIPNKKGCSNC